MDKALLTRATGKDDTPTPGYLYGEISRMTQHSYETCGKVMDFLISRVKNKHHTIKFKALQVIKHICREGRTDFKREMQRHIPIIKECLQFRGPPDPLKGDEYYRRVRDSAKECLDAIYDTDITPGLGTMGISARIQGVGNPEENSNSSGWGAKLPWGKNHNDSAPQAPAIGELPRYPPPAPLGGYNVPSHPNAYGPPGADHGLGGYTGPAPVDNMQYNHNPGAYPSEYSYGGAPMPPYSHAPQFHDQRMAGIGNPLFQDARDEKGFLKGLKQKATSRFSKSDHKSTLKGAPPGAANPPDGWSFATNRGPTGGNYGYGGVTGYNPEEQFRPKTYGGGYRAGSAAYMDSSSDPREAATQLREKSYDGDRKKGRVGGCWSNIEVPAPTQNAPPASSHMREPQHMQRTSSQEYHRPQEYKGRGGHIDPPSNVGQTTGAQLDGSYERNLVTALCAPGGMRAVPPKDKMESFLKCAPTLDPDIVGPILEDCLADEQWTVVSKALATIEALIKADGCDALFEYFTDNSAEIEACTQSDKAAVRDRAIKIMQTLGLSVNATAYAKPVEKSSMRASNSHAQTDLLGDFDQANNSGQISLFAGLQTQAAPSQIPETPPSVPESVADMFSGLSVQPENTAQTQIQSSIPPSSGNGNASMVLDPLLQPVPCPMQPSSIPNYNMNMLNYASQQIPHMHHMAQMQQMRYMQQLHYVQQMQGVSPVQGTQMSSQVIGAAMTPSGYIAKTIQDPSEGANSGFNFMKKQDDSFNFVKDAMKNG